MLKLILSIGVLWHSMATVVPFTRHHLQQMNDEGDNAYFLILSYPKQQDPSTYLKHLEELDQLYNGTLTILKIDSSSPMYGEVCYQIGVNNSRVELSYHISCHQKTNSVFTGMITIETLNAFVDRMVKDRVRTLRSEEQPVHQDQILKLVGSTFTSYISQAQTQTVVLLYHHQEHKSIFTFARFQKLGLRLRNNPNIVFATFDIAVNQLLQAELIKKYPVVLFFPADKSAPQLNEGHRKPQKFYQWLRQLTTFDWVQPGDEQSVEEAIEEYR